MVWALLAAALLLVVAVGWAVASRRKAKGDVIDVPADAPVRRRAAGAAILATEGEALAIDEAPLRPRAALGLTPYLASEEAPAEAETVEDADAAVAALAVEPDFADGPAPANDEGEIVLLARADAFSLAPTPEPVVVADAPATAFAPGEGGSGAFGDEPPSILAQLGKKKKAKGGPLSGAVEDGPAPASRPEIAAPREVEEDVTLVLRRTIPARLDEEPRSWIGGRPRLPESIEWPCAVEPERPGAGPVPLNFVAQLACEDFPADLWGGVGPRSGWLLFFLNPRDSVGDDPRLFKVLHIDELGPERAPPAGTPPVHDEVYAGADYRHVRSAEEIPSEWRRWPVDLVALPNQAFQDGEKVRVTPRNFAEQLYDGAPVAAGLPDLSAHAPFSWRGALHIIDSILRQLDQPFAPPPIGPGLREALAKPGYVASLVPMLRRAEELWLAEGEGAILSKEEPLTQRQREAQEALRPVAMARQAALEQAVAFIVENPTADRIVARIEAGHRAEAEWRSAARVRLEEVRAGILARPLDTPLDDSDWQALAAHLDDDRFTRWSLGWTSRNSDYPVALEAQEICLLDLADAGLSAALESVAADYYADPTRHALIPPVLLAELEPYWRQLHDNRPHRVGGFHDGLQSDPEPGAQPEVLMLQLATDPAMHMMWGDEGAYFLFIAPHDLANSRFDQANIRLECY